MGTRVAKQGFRSLLKRFISERRGHIERFACVTDSDQRRLRVRRELRGEMHAESEDQPIATR
jgi:hypothetical protein